MLDPEERAERKARRFLGRCVYIVKDTEGVDHYVLSVKMKGTITMAKAVDRKTLAVTTLINSDGFYERQNGRWV